MNDNYFVELNNINVAEHIEKKNGLSYLSWAWAWGELKKRYPKAFYTVYEDSEGRFYHNDGKTAWVKTGVTVEGLEHIEYLPIMDYRNKSIPLASLTSFDVNKAIQRSLTKAVARHGLGLYIYAGEDLPEEEKKAQSAKKEPPLPEILEEDYRQKLIGFCEKNGYDMKKISEKYKLNKKSNQNDFKIVFETLELEEALIE